MIYKDCQPIENHLLYDISHEEYREYVNLITDTSYKIHNPIALYIKKNGTGHRIVSDDGVSHWHEASVPGVNAIVIRWKAKPTINPVMF